MKFLLENSRNVKHSIVNRKFLSMSFNTLLENSYAIDNFL